MSPRLAESSNFRSSAVSGVAYWIAKLSDPRELVTENCKLSLERATLFSRAVTPARTSPTVLRPALSTKAVNLASLGSVTLISTSVVPKLLPACTSASTRVSLSRLKRAKACSSAPVFKTWPACKPSRSIT